MSRQRLRCPISASHARLLDQRQSTWVPFCLITLNPANWQTKISYDESILRRQEHRRWNFATIERIKILLASMISATNENQPWIEVLVLHHQWGRAYFDAFAKRENVLPFIRLALSRYRPRDGYSTVQGNVSHSNSLQNFRNFPRHDSAFVVLSDPSYPFWHEADKLKRQTRWLTSTTSSRKHF